MKIGVVSDTHSQEIPQQLIKDFADVDLIVHAGDFCSKNVYDSFTKMKTLKAVYGNMDEADLCRKLPQKNIFECGGLRIGVYHGEGPAKRVIDFVREEFKDDKVDVVIFGHSHHPLNEIIDNVLYFNPGSPNDKVHAPYCSYGMLEIKDGKANGKIIKVK